MSCLTKPQWISVRVKSGTRLENITADLRSYGLNTVCEQACCPNIADCWHQGTLTLMLLGVVCTRACKFCATQTGNPHGAVDTNEPRRVADFVQSCGTDYVVLTSVTRDDLCNGGADVFAETIQMLRKTPSPIGIEVLVPDFGGSVEAIQMLVGAQPDIIGHNLETVSRLSRMLRDKLASYTKSLRMMETIKSLDSQAITKSGSSRRA